MNNLMNISTMLIGIISIVISLGILLVFVFLNIKKETFKLRTCYKQSFKFKLV